MNIFLFLIAQYYYSWTHYTDIKDTKVVILGQDPYHGPGQAHGLCFSVQKGVSAPPSLVNMYKELKEDIPGFIIPNHGFLEGWAKQGVLLLNACLTVRQSEANSHKDRGWEKLTNAVVKYISSHCHGVVFLLGILRSEEGIRCGWQEASLAQNRSSFAAVCSSWLPRLQTFLQMQSAARERWEDPD